MTTKPRLALGLGRAISRTIPWWHLFAAAALGGMFVGMARTAADANTAGTVQALRIAAVTLATGLAFVFDDPSEGSLAGTPVTVGARRLLRVVLVVPVAGCVWFGLLLLAVVGTDLTRPGTTVGESLTWLRAGGLTLEFIGLVSLTLAVAATSMWFSRSETGGTVAGPAVLGFAAGAAVLPGGAGVWFWAPYIPLSAGPSHPWSQWWVAAHQRWALLIVVAVTAACFFSRDRGRWPATIRLLPRQASSAVSALQERTS